MSATERRAAAVAAETPQAAGKADTLVVASREAGQAAADAWAIWLAAWQEMAAQQFSLLNRLMDRALPAADGAQASRETEPDPTRTIRLARQGCQRMIQGARAANDAAVGWYFDMAGRTAGQIARQLSAGFSSARAGGDAQDSAR